VSITLRPLASALALVATMAASPALHAAGFGDMFNPGRWFGGNNNDYDDYYDGPYGPYGGGPYGPPGYGAYGVPGYGYGAMPYGYAPGVVPGVAPGYAAPAVAAPPAAGSQDAKDQEIEALKRRIDQLENRQNAAPPAPSAAESWPSAPAFRPMDQY
jgi:hypothetical protein